MINGQIRLDDGSLEIIRHVDDFAQLIETRLGYDATEMFREFADKMAREVAAAESDFTSYERELDELQATIRELERKPHTLLSISSKQYLSKADKIELRRLAEAIRGLLDLAS